MRVLGAAALAAVLCAGTAGCSGSGRDGGGGASAEAAASSREISFDVHGTTTYGTLQIPAHHAGQRLPAALILAGSGPTDRDGDQNGKGTHNLQLIADVLDKMGISTLRFDKYFSGRTGFGKYQGHPGAIDLNAFIQQADDAYKLLYQQPTTDTGRLLVVGHSEGGMYAMLVADTVSPHPVGLALLEPQDERFLDNLDVQINEMLDAAVGQGTLGNDAARQQAQLVKQAIAQFRAGQPVDTTGILQGIVTLLDTLIVNPDNALYDKTDDEVYPPQVAAKLPGAPRVLITDGTADAKVPTFTIQPLVDALHRAGTTGPGLVTLDGVDHDLHPPGSGANDQLLAPAFISALQDWARPYASTSS